MARKKNHNNKKGFALGALFGSVCGGVTALLLAPKSGEKMRKEIAKKYHKASDKAGDLICDFKNCSSKMVHKVKGAASNAKSSASKFLKR